MSAAVATVLRTARGLIDRGWTRGACARDAAGNPVDVDSSVATCFCALGATGFNSTADHDGWLDAVAVLERQVDPRWGRSVSAFNDHPATTQADVLALFDRAIAAAEAGGA